MGQDFSQSMQSPIPTQMNTARGMDPMQGAIGAGGPGLGGNKGGMVTPAQPDFPMAENNPPMRHFPTSAVGGALSSVDHIKNLIARMMKMRGGF